MTPRRPRTGMRNASPLGTAGSSPSIISANRHSPAGASAGTVISNRKRARRAARYRQFVAFNRHPRPAAARPQLVVECHARIRCERPVRRADPILRGLRAGIGDFDDVARAAARRRGELEAGRRRDRAESLRSCSFRSTKERCTGEQRQCDGRSRTNQRISQRRSRSESSVGRCCSAGCRRSRSAASASRRASAS